MLCNEEDFSAALGYDVPGMHENLSSLDPEGFKQMIRQVVKDFPFKAVATTLRKATTATRNDWGAICYCEGDFFKAKKRENLEILDRVGGGDSFARLWRHQHCRRTRLLRNQGAISAADRAGAGDRFL